MTVYILDTIPPFTPPQEYQKIFFPLHGFANTGLLERGKMNVQRVMDRAEEFLRKT